MESATDTRLRIIAVSRSAPRKGGCTRPAAARRRWLIDVFAAVALGRLPAMARTKYTHRSCAVCRVDRDFKTLDERDIKGRILMVCTRCSSKIPVPGQKNPTWAELLVSDD